jgi:hypothetical protein
MVSKAAVRIAALGFSLVAGAGLALLYPLHASAARDAAKAGPAEQAANSFLLALTPEQRTAATFAADAKERTDWHFIPKDRVGLAFHKMDDTQSELLGPLLATALSENGLVLTRGVMKHENTLRRVEVESSTWTQARPRDPGLYFTTIFGKPSSDAPWAWRFEGHHLSVNVTQLPGQPTIVAPLFIGANPARVPTGANMGFRLLPEEEDFARALMRALTAERQKKALIAETAFEDILTRNDPKVQGIEAAGLAASEMSAADQRQLRKLLNVYIARFNADYGRDVLDRIEKSGFGKIRFAWAGSTDIGAPHYYRIHGPTLLVEYDNTQNNANHIHTVWRDLQRDLGGDALRAHYQRASHDEQSRVARLSRP